MQRVRVVFLAANPFLDLKINDEVRDIRARIRESVFRNAELFYEPAVRTGELISRLDETKPHIVHFSGHGSQEHELILLDERGSPLTVHRSLLAELFRLCHDNLRVVVLNFCHSLPIAEEIREVVPCVIGTTGAIPDQAARFFAAQFYGSLSNGRTIRESFDRAVLQLRLQNIGGGEVLRLLHSGVADQLRLVEPEEGAPEPPHLPDGAGHERREAGARPGPRVGPLARSRPTVAQGRVWGWVETNSDLLTVAVAGLAIAVIALTAMRTRVTGITSAVCTTAAAGTFAAYRVSMRRRVTRELVDLAERNVIDRPGFFRVRPYDDSPDDQQLFDRADGAHEEVLHWLLDSRDPVLFLSGVSGTGKSSLLYAYVLPKLRRAPSGTPARDLIPDTGRLSPPRIREVVVRNYDDPIGLLVSGVRRLGVLEPPPPDTTEPSELLRLTAGASGGRLLLVLDQFEQLLITQEASASRFEAFIALLKTLVRAPIPGVTCLIVLRADYLGFLEELGIATITLNENLKLIKAFRPRDACNFLSRSGLRVDPAYLRQAVHQLANVEKTEGLIRPITLNMLGLALVHREPADITSLPDVEQILTDYCRSCISRPVAGPYAPAILRPLISRLETIQPRTVADLARRTNLRAGVVRGVLLNLGNDGLVRRVDAADDLWEVAHDFVAHLLAGLLRRSLALKVGVPVAATVLFGLTASMLYHYGSIRAPVTTPDVTPITSPKETTSTPRPAAIATKSEDVSALRSMVVGKNVRISGPNSNPRSESDIRVFFGNPKHVIAASDNPLGGQEAQYFSMDGGATWRQTLLPLVEGDSMHSDANVDWTSGGKAWALTIGISAGSTSLRLRAYRSDDQGQTWTFDGTPSGEQTSADAPRMWIDQSRTSPTRDTIYAIWHNNQPAFVNRRTAGGWQVPVRVSGPETTGTAIGGAITTNAKGEVFAVWPDTGSRKLYFAKSVDGGKTYSPPTRVASTFASFDIGVPAFAGRKALIMTSIAAFRDASRDDVYVSWVDLSGEPGCDNQSSEPGRNVDSRCKSRIWFTRSTDGGLHWEVAKRVNDSVHDLSDQFNQRLAIDPETGTLGLIYYNSGEVEYRRMTNLVCQVSTNHGESWSRPITVTDDMTDETTSKLNQGNQYGDANGLTVAKGVFLASWTDRRDNGVEAIFSARIIVKDSQPEVIAEDGQGR
jgi:hypothetical protein